jgi:diguanylate cyclase (GGDEF)-like protein
MIRHVSLPSDHLLRSLACAMAGVACAATWPVEFGAWAALGNIAIAGIGWWRIGPPALAALLPVAGLAADDTWPMWSGWSAASLACAATAAMWMGRSEDNRVLPLRRELRDRERERADLDRQIRRFPLLLDACVALSAARELDQFAGVLAVRTRAVAPESGEVLVFLARGGEPICRAGLDASGVAVRREADVDERYVAAEARALIRRSPGEVRVIAPLRADRRQVQGAVAGEAPRGALSVRLVVGEDGGRVAVELTQALARLGGIALAAVELVEQARGMALRDELTGLLGRHEFLRRLDEQIAQARRARTPLAVVMCDMDHLKRYNDAFGHPAGDAALRSVAQALERVLPSGGLACRWGGEEFCASAMVQDAEGLVRLGEKIRAAVAAAVPEAEHPERHVTASLGATLVRDGEGARATLERADVALYRSKDDGRDRVTVTA